MVYMRLVHLGIEAGGGWGGVALEKNDFPFLFFLQGRSAPSKSIFEMGTFPMSDGNYETTFVCQQR